MKNKVLILPITDPEELFWVEAKLLVCETEDHEDLPNGLGIITVYGIDFEIESIYVCSYTGVKIVDITQHCKNTPEIMEKVREYFIDNKNNWMDEIE